MTADPSFHPTCYGWRRQLPHAGEFKRSVSAPGYALYCIHAQRSVSDARWSAATGRQAKSASGVAGNIQNILTVTEQTQQGTQQTAQSIHALSRLAEELKNSVSRFRVA